ncbi:MAG: hydroxymethylpyrimidine/phosphomethylpyrimidine kinase [Methylococcales bacterium]|nr:hydroxymethylpyrimidine/phosphomethylpyrimidine kinase [Methylococcales bacterium]
MTRPVVLSLSGHDPTGGAGIQADIEAIGALGGRALSLVTALTEQDSVNVFRIWPQSPDALRRQAKTLLSDMAVSVVKIGLLGDAEIARVAAEIVETLPKALVVLDPVLAAGGGTELASAELLTVIRQRLLPKTTLLTPNSPEARRLAGHDNLTTCARWLLERGCRAVLLTGGHEQDDRVCNRLYQSDKPTQTWHWPRLPECYHGSGCTLAAAVAAALASGDDLPSACGRGQAFAWEALAQAEPVGAGQWLPWRR